MVERAGRCRCRSPLEGVLPPVGPWDRLDPLPEATLGWTAPRFRHPEQADRWTWLVLLAYAQLRLARLIAADRRLPWERPQRPRRLTPTRVLRSFATLLASVGTQAEPPKAVRQVSRASERQPHGAGQTPSSAQNLPPTSKPLKLNCAMLVSEVLGQPALLKRQAQTTDA